MAIFEHTDSDDDSMRVVEHSGIPGLRFVSRLHDGYDQDVAVDYSREAVQALHNALGEWLYPVHTPEYANRSLIEQMIEKAVRDQVAAVLPLHLKTAGVYVHGRNCPGRLFCQDANGVQVIDCQNEPDPEPHDVGHAEEPPKAEPEHGRLMTELPRRTRPRQPAKCLDCQHGWGEHTGGICWGAGGQDHEGDGCKCTRERPSAAPAKCTCPVGPRIRSYPHSHIAGCPRSTSGAS